MFSIFCRPKRDGERRTISSAKNKQAIHGEIYYLVFLGIFWMYTRKRNHVQWLLELQDFLQTLGICAGVSDLGLPLSDNQDCFCDVKHNDMMGTYKGLQQVGPSSFQQGSCCHDSALMKVKNPYVLEELWRYFLRKKIKIKWNESSCVRGRRIQRVVCKRGFLSIILFM